jgi:4-diphosphocytidyl-2-C-methyl-D-erythritol kinase
LTNPGFEVSTPAAYAKLNRLTRSEVARSIPFTLLAAKGIGELPLAARNDFEEVVVAVHPEIGELKRVLLSMGARHALMSGSGGTVFGVFDNPKSSEAAVAALRERGLWSASASTIARSEYRKRSDGSVS